MIPTNKTISVLHPYVNQKGGAVKMMIYLSEFLLEKKNDVTFYTFSYNKNYFSGEKTKIIFKSFYNSKITKIFSFFIIAFQIRKSDYVFIGNSPMHFVGVLSKVLFFSKAKLIWWNHHYPWYYNENTNTILRLKKGLEKCIVKRLDLVLSNSQYLQSSIKDIYNIPSQILHPILDNEFENISGDFKIIPPTICIYGRWVAGKNLSLAFRMYENLKEKIPDLVLKIGGDGEEVSEWKQRYDNNDNVQFMGELNSRYIIKLLQESDVLLFPSLIDSFGLVIIESMSTGTPVVCYNRAGAKELVVNGVNGYLVDSENECTEKLYSVITNDKLKTGLSKGALDTAKGFTKQSFETQLESIFTLL